MNQRMRYLCALLLALVCVPAFAAKNDCPALQSFGANDVQTGQTVTIEWSYQGNAVPQSQTLTGHDFDEAVILAPNATSYSYVATKPGEKHVQLTAVTSCGTVTRTAKYQVKQCNIVEPIVTIGETHVAAGETIHASIDLLPGYDVRWEATNATTTSSLTSPTIEFTATAPGVVTINAYVSRGNCMLGITRTVEVEAACAIAEPQIYSPDHAAPNEWFWLYVPEEPGRTVTFEVHGARVTNNDGVFVDVIAPATGSFSIDIIVSNGTCSRTFTRTFSVLPCNAGATVSAGQSGACGANTIVAEFTGDAPFQGYWSDGENFWTYDHRIERTVTVSGTYTITWFRDNYCEGPISGSATVGASLPAPQFELDGIVGGFFLGTDTCPGMLRTARLTAPIPAGATPEWSIVNGTIVSGQGTGVVTFTGDAPGPSPLSVVFRDANGCTSAAATEPYLLTQGTPEGTISVEPSTIPLGGTAIITVTRNNYVRGFDVNGTLGDQIIPIGDGPQPNTFQYEYRSSQGAGVSTLTYRMMNTCQVTTYATATLTVDGSTVLPAKASVRAIGSSCGDWAAYAEFTGVAPFSGTWSNGQTFTISEPYAFLYPRTGGSYTLIEFRDANGAGTVTGSADFNFTGLPQPEISAPFSACPNEIVTATLTSAVPEGASVQWQVWGGEIVSGQGTSTMQFRIGEYGAPIEAHITGPNACSPAASAYTQSSSYVSDPGFALWGVEAGSSVDFNVYLDPMTETWGFENTLGDTIEIIDGELPVVTLRYTSTHGYGSSDVRVYGTTRCGASFESTHTMQVLPPPPNAFLSWVTDPNCGATITVKFTGIAPFSGTWQDGESFSTNDSSITRFVTVGGTYHLTSFTDAYRGGGSNWIDVFAHSCNP